MFNRELTWPVLGLLSVFLVLWQTYGMNRTLVLQLGNNIDVEMLNDSVSGGASIGSLTQDKGNFSLTCKIIRTGNIFPFCSARVPLNTRAEPQDLTSFDTLEFSLEYTGGDRDTILVYLTSTIPYGDTGQVVEKAMLRTIDPKLGVNHYVLSLESFQVPSWWMFAHPGAESSVDLSAVNRIQFSTGDAVHNRIETITVSGIVLRGKWISQQHLIFLIAGLWMIAIIYQATMFLIRIRKESKELQKLNSLLNVENQKLETLAKTDPLTNLLNRAGLREELDEIVRQFRLRKEPASVIIFDIDHFKSVNDTLGHDVGDKVLVELASLVQSSVRGRDVLARWGGEEFVLLCPRTKSDDAARVAEKLRLTIANADLLEDRKISCSFGVSELQVADISLCFKSADEALYQAKEDGRNLVCQK